MIDFVVFHQRVTDGKIKFVTSEMEAPATMKYDEFMVFLKQWEIDNYVGLRNQIDSFKQVLLLPGTPSYWEILKEETRAPHSYKLDELLKLNPNQSSLAKKEPRGNQLQQRSQMLFKKVLDRMGNRSKQRILD